jgi:hypothetical protein
MLGRRRKLLGVSAVGAGISAATIRHVIATLLVFLAVFSFFYGPPLAQKFSEAAHRECNRMTGSTYRTYELEWRTTTYDSINPPEWICHDRRDAEDTGTSLGWWVDL